MLCPPVYIWWREGVFTVKRAGVIVIIKKRTFFVSLALAAAFVLAVVSAQYMHNSAWH